MTQVQTATSQTAQYVLNSLPVGRSVSLDQAAQLLNVSRRTIYNRIKDGQLATVRAGGSQRVLVASLQALALQS
jgi:excisionase family DNA binding protein